MKSCHRIFSPKRFALAGVLVLAACQTSYGDNENSPYFVPAPGTRLILNQPLTIPPDQVAVWLQDGRVLASETVRSYYPHCKLELRQRLPQPQRVEPDEFMVTRVARSLLHSVRAPGPAAEGAFVAVGFGFGLAGSTRVETFVTRLDLGSARQPEVLRMTCGQWGYREDPYNGRYVTIGEVRRALGDIFTLRLAETTR